jgi:hypothetical protein
VKLSEKEISPHISRQPSREGREEILRLFSSETSMITDYLLLLSGVVEGDGGVIAQIEERYTITTTEELDGSPSFQPMTSQTPANWHRKTIKVSPARSPRQCQSTFLVPYCVVFFMLHGHSRPEEGLQLDDLAALDA